MTRENQVRIVITGADLLKLLTYVIRLSNSLFQVGENPKNASKPIKEWLRGADDLPKELETIGATVYPTSLDTINDLLKETIQDGWGGDVQAYIETVQTRLPSTVLTDLVNSAAASYNRRNTLKPITERARNKNDSRRFTNGNGVS